jgi:hypothetical protein
MEEEAKKREELERASNKTIIDLQREPIEKLLETLNEREIPLREEAIQAERLE